MSTPIIRFRYPSFMQRVNWSISRMRRLFAIWDNGLDLADKAYCLRRIRDKEPALFYGIAREVTR